MRDRLRAALPFFGFFTCPVLTLILTELYLYNPFREMKWAPWMLNIVLYWLLAAFLFALTGRLVAALRIETAFFMLAGLANYYVFSFRSSPILPWDIFSMGTAASVADNFSYALPGKIWLVLAGFGVLLVAEQPFSARVRKLWLRLAGVAVCALVLAGFTAYVQQEATVRQLRLYDKLFTPDVVQKRNGLAVAFAMELQYLFVEKPGGYDAGEAKELLASLEGGEAMEEAPAGEPGGESEAPPSLASGELPHIIVIMDEAFSDIAYVGDLSCNRDYMPFVHSLMEADNVVSGRLHVSVLGGNTANTEFEFLTGNTMAFLPEGSIPYQQYIRGPVPSLVSELGKFGYASVAMHPYRAAGWSRDKVYPWFGFEQMRFIEDYPDAVYVRKYVSDQSDFERLIAEYEQRDRGRPLFLFNVTMQNHGGYDQEFDNFTPDITAEGIENEAVSRYLSLISLTDQALEGLVSYFEQEKEPVLLLFFGDHQPNDSVASPIRRQSRADKQPPGQRSGPATKFLLSCGPIMTSRGGMAWRRASTIWRRSFCGRLAYPPRVITRICSSCKAASR